MSASTPFHEALKIFATRLTTAYGPGAILGAQLEAQLTSPVTDLLRYYPNVHVAPEIPMPGIGRPDLGVQVASLLTGYVELKPPGKGATPAKFKDKHDKAQWEKFKALPNVLYTDGLG